VKTQSEANFKCVSDKELVSKQRDCDHLWLAEACS